jgi:L-ribulokinase
VTGNDDRYVVGIDFGTLSGRALVVRVSDGAELGTAVHEYSHAVIDTTLPGHRRRAAAGLGPAGPERLP